MSRTSLDHVVIVGSGIGSLFAALYLSKQSTSKITLLEKQNALGGLLRSTELHGHYFDYGTHVISESNDEVVNETLLHDVLDLEEWNTFKPLEAATYYEGLSELGPNMNLMHASSENKHRYAYSMLANEKVAVNNNSLLEWSLLQFGEAITHEVVAPIMKKLTGKELDEIHASTSQLLGIQRFILFPEQASIRLKELPYLDNRLSFSHVDPSRSTLSAYYPKDAGIQKWIDEIERTLLMRGVTIIKEAHLEEVTKNETGFNISYIQNGIHYDSRCDHLFWGAPPSIVEAMLGQPRKASRPTIRKTIVLHLKVTKVPIVTAHYITNYQPTHLLFRVTNYYALRGLKEPTLTVEVMVDQAATFSQEVIEARVLEELKAMGVVTPDTDIEFAAMAEISNGFPVLPVDIGEDKELPDVTFVGRTTQRFFMKDVIAETKVRIDKLLGGTYEYAGSQQQSMEQRD